MSASTVGEYTQHAAAHVRRQRKSLKRHWLTAAFIFLLVAASTWMAWHLYGVKARLNQVRASRGDLEAQLSVARRSNERLAADLNRVTDESYMELAAKSLGFVYPQEAVYQPATR